MQNKLKRIALVSSGLKQAGAQSVVCSLANGMKHRGLDVSVFAFRGGPLYADLQEAGIAVHILADKKREQTHNYFHSIKMTLRMAYLLKSKMIQAMNIHGLGAERIALLASRIAGTQVKTFVFHSNYPRINPAHSDCDYRLIKRLRNNLSQTNHCIAISDKIRELVIKSSAVKPNSISIINNGINITNARATAQREKSRVSLGFNDQDILVIQVGRFSPLKNQEISVKAVSLIKNRFPNLHLLLVGDGSNLVHVKDLTKRLYLLNRIHFLGFRRDVANLLGAADLFLLPSSHEGVPISLLEAFANGLPAVCSNVPGISDIISLAPASAKLVDPEDENALAIAIAEALEDQQWISGAKMAGLRLVEERFSNDEMIDQYVSLHEKLLSKFKRLGNLAKVASIQDFLYSVFNRPPRKIMQCDEKYIPLN